MQMSYILRRVFSEYMKFMMKTDGEHPDTLLAGKIEYAALHDMECTFVNTRHKLHRVRNLKVLRMKVEEVKYLTYLKVLKGAKE